MTRTALSPSRARRVLWRGGLGVTLAIGLLAGTPTVALAADGAHDVVYRFPFDPHTTTPAGGEFASTLANGDKRAAPHRGHDFSFGGALGADIPAIADGIVRAVSKGRTLGHCVALEHADGAFSAYCHMQKPTPLHIGDVVQRGEPVGKVGGSGHVPVHLHLTMGWSVDVIGGIDTFDPIPYIAERLAPPKPKPKPAAEKPVEHVAPPVGIAVTHSMATAV